MTITSKIAKRPHRVGTTSTQVRLQAGGREQLVRLANLSLEGACLAPQIPVAAGETLHLSLCHPHVETAPQLWAQVRWAQAGGVGVKFVDPPPGAKLLIRRCMLAEFGSAVLLDQQVLGYMVPVKPRVWSFYDRRVAKRADLEQADHGLFVKQGAGRERVSTLAEAAARAFGVSRQPAVEPTPEGLAPAAPAPAESSRAEAKEESLRGSAVYHEGLLQGFVVMTGARSWSFYDPEQFPAGFMTKDDEGPLKIVLLGENDDGSLDLRAATNYPEALAVAFGLEHPPELRSAVIRPAF